MGITHEYLKALLWGGMETLRVGRNILYTVYADIITITYINICLEDPPNEDILTEKHDIIMAHEPSTE